MFNARDNLDNGEDISQSCYPTYTPPFIFLNYSEFDELSDVDEGEASYSSCASMSSDDNG